MRCVPAIPSRSPGRRSGEAGYILLGVLILLFLFTLALGIAAPIVAKDIQRDKDEEAVQRGKQYKRAIRMYYKKFNTYPTSIAQLENTNQIRFLRKRYIDPVTGKDDWRLIHVGEAKVPVLGFFGQPLQAGTSSVTTGLAGNGTGGIGNGSTIAGNGTGDTSGSAGGSTGDPNAPAAPIGQLPGMSSGAGTPSSGAGVGTGSNGTAGGFGSSVASQSSSIGGGSVGPIVGVGVPVDKKSLVIYHKQAAYNKWEFTYDPIEEQMYSGSSGIPGAQPIAGSGGTPGAGSSSPFAQNPSNNSNNSNSQNGNAGSSNNSGGTSPTSSGPN